MEAVTFELGRRSFAENLFRNFVALRAVKFFNVADEKDFESAVPRTEVFQKRHYQHTPEVLQCASVFGVRVIHPHDEQPQQLGIELIEEGPVCFGV